MFDDPLPWPFFLCDDDEDDGCSIFLFFSSLLIAANLNFHKGKFQIFGKFMQIRSFLLENYAKLCKLSKSWYPPWQLF